MRGICFGLVSLVVGLGALCGTSSAADVSVGVELNSAYVWRGMTLNDGLVIQPSGLLTAQGFDLFVWGNINMDDYDGALETGEFSEVDVDVSYGRTLAGIDVRLGAIQYIYPHDGSFASTNAAPTPRESATAEVYATLSRKIVGGLSIELDAFYDFDEVRDGYGELILSYEAAAGDNLLVTTGASMAIVGRRTSDLGEDGLHQYELFVRAVLAFESGLGIAGHVAYTDTLDKHVLAEQDTNLYGGISIKQLF